MFNKIEEALEALVQRRKSLFPELGKFSKAMDFLGNPQKKLKVIHVAGTNGKGSTTDFIRSICQKQGYKTATFTSPHLISHHDRFRINNVPISDQDLLYWINETYPLWDQFDLTMFEIDVLISVLYFLDQRVDIVVYEVGLGGRFDATNIVTPLASVITNISFDHMAILGDTLEKIATEKAGIIKESGLVMTGEKKPECLSVFQAKANRTLWLTQPIEETQVTSQGVQFVYRGYQIQLQSHALYQSYNAALAFEVCYQLTQQHVLHFDMKSILEGLCATQWAGRFEVVSKDPLVILDGAHNEDGIYQLTQSLPYLKKPLVCVFSALADKEHEKMIQQLVKACDQVIVTEFDFYRRDTAEHLAHDCDVLIEKDWHQAISKAKELANGGSVVITGSLYFISEVRKEFTNK